MEEELLQLALLASLQAGNEADTLQGAEEGDEGGLEGELLQVALLANFRAGKPEKRKAKKSQKQLYAVESALAQRKRKGSHTSHRLQENEEGDDDDSTGIWGQAELESLEKGKRTKTVACPHGKARSYSSCALYSVCLFIFGFHAPTLTEENELLQEGEVCGVWGSKTCEHKLLRCGLCIYLWVLLPPFTPFEGLGFRVEG